MDLQNVIIRLVNCGYSHADATIAANDFLKVYSDKELEEYIESLEFDNVGKRKYKSNFCTCGGLCSTCNCKGVEC
jgi:predicted flavoprotein YhiN